ncbi:hypothetical protein FL857_04350 [Criibacterium bergeronii]|uniref:Uncharacterized protein n=1 Tax=Criibacterium bergeronii TaxID=1871336 RepID=A0A552VBE6_9FIRM|nr:hypothetical protein [Criibacterium bergeronii]TRW27805.1 hypothetical protein FL857_04350 [Criibacterium bergeronii]
MSKKIEKSSLFYNLLDMLKKEGEDKSGRVPDMFGGLDTELDYICKIYCEEFHHNEINIPGRSTFQKHRKIMRENLDSLSGKEKWLGDYETILNALFWYNCLIPIRKTKDEEIKAAKITLLKNNIYDVFDTSLGFSCNDADILNKLCEGDIYQFIKKVNHIAMFPQDIKIIRETLEKTKNSSDYMKIYEEQTTVMTLILMSDNISESFEFKACGKQLEKALQISGKEKFKLHIITFSEKDNKLDKIVKNIIKSSNYIYLIVGKTSFSVVYSLVKYSNNCIKTSSIKSVLYIPSYEKYNVNDWNDKLNQNEITYIYVKRYSDKSEVLFDIARKYITENNHIVSKAEIRSEKFILDGMYAIDLKNHPMFSTDTLILLKKKLSNLDEEYDYLLINRQANITKLDDIDSKRRAILSKIRQCENIICDCQLSAIGIEHTGTVLDELIKDVEICYVLKKGNMKMQLKF